MIEDERNGVYAGSTVQMIPHITNKIKEHIRLNAATNNAEVAIVEIGGTVGDYESLPFLEALRQFSIEDGFENCMYFHFTLVPVIMPTNELKTKPTQFSVKELRSIGIQPDILVCRSDRPIGPEIKQKISLFCSVKPENVIENLNMPSLYEIPLALEKEGLAEQVIKRLKIKCKPKNLTDWKAMVAKSKVVKSHTNVALVGKYIELHDAYLSVVEALKHAAIFNETALQIHWIDSEDINENNTEQLMRYGLSYNSGRFREKRIDGKIFATKYARENNIPFLGLCLGLQIALIEFARNVANLKRLAVRVRPRYATPHY